MARASWRTHHPKWGLTLSCAFVWCCLFLLFVRQRRWRWLTHSSYWLYSTKKVLHQRKLLPPPPPPLFCRCRRCLWVFLDPTLFRLVVIVIVVVLLLLLWLFASFVIAVELQLCCGFLVAVEKRGGRRNQLTLFSFVDRWLRHLPPSLLRYYQKIGILLNHPKRF